MTDLENIERMLKELPSDITHKHNPGWVSEDRLIVSVGQHRLCFSFNSNGKLISLALGPWQDQV